MPYNPEKHHRRNIRLKGYDYARPGAYFVTICTQDRVCLFAEVVDGAMRMNDAGQMVQRWWNELNQKFPNVKTDAFVVMPNHIHGIIMIQSTNETNDSVGADLRVRPDGTGICVEADLRVCPIHPDETDTCVRADLRVCPNSANNVS